MTGAVPASARAWLRSSAVFLVVVAAAGNITHGYDFLEANGQAAFLAGVGAVSPDVLLLSSVIRLRYQRRHAWSWVGLTASTGFVLWAGVATAGAGFTAKAVSAWPVLVAVIAAGLMETSSAPAQEPIVPDVPDESEPDHEAAPDLPVREIPEREPVRVPVLPPAAAASVADDVLPVHLVELGQAVAADLADAGQRLSKRTLIEGFRAREQSISSDRAAALTRHLKAASAAS